jgi:predicted ATPase
VSLVGRRVELSLLASALDTAAHGECSVVALSGDAGIGKSRLAEECVALARDREFVVLEGGASLYQQDLPYASIVEALRPVVRDDSQERARLVEGLSDLRRLFDELPVAAPSPVGDPGVERTRLFEAVCRLLERVSARQPLLLVLDDLQWADSSSLMLLLYLVRGLRRRGFVAVCVYRVNESGDQLRALMSSLRRLGLLVEVALGPLERNETAQLVHHLVGDHAPAALLDVIDSRAQGVPLFVTALVASLRKSGTLARQGGRWVLGPGGEEVPAAVKDLFLSRLAGLGAAARRVLEAVSVLGDAVDGDHVLAVLGHDDDFRACVDTLVDAGLLVEDLGSGRVMYRISHPLLAQIVYDQMSSFARQRMHANAEVVLSRRQPSDWIRRAHHVLRAGDDLSPRYAVEILAAATEAALVQRAGAEGVQFGQSAVALGSAYRPRRDRARSAGKGGCCGGVRGRVRHRDISVA